MKILVLCTGNSCRSQMAQAFLKSFDRNIEVYSAGTAPAPYVHPLAIRVMQELGIDISNTRPKHVNNYIDTQFDYVITVCNDAKESCPIFTGKVKHHLHIGFDDPALATGTKEEQYAVFCRVRDQIKETFRKFYNKNIKK